MPEPKGTIKVRLDLPTEYHSTLTAMAGRANMTRAAFVREVIVRICRGERVAAADLAVVQQLPDEPPPQPKRGRPASRTTGKLPTPSAPPAEKPKRTRRKTI